MRKRTVNHFFDDLMWYFLYTLPLLIALITFCNNNDLGYLNCLNTFLTGIQLDTNIIYESLVDIFGSSGSAFTLFSNNTLFLYFTYFISLLIVHIVVDILALLPRVCHKLIEKCTK